MPSFAVIVPAHRAERTLPDTIRSIEAQTVRPNEVLIVHDAAGRGAAWARNEATRRATSEWLVLLDADDVACPERLARLCDVCSPELDMVYHQVEYFDDATGAAIRVGGKAASDVFDALCDENFVCCSAAAVRRQAWLDAGGMRSDLAGVEDWWMWFTLARSRRVAFIPAPLSRYRVGTTSMMRGRSALHYARTYSRLCRAARASGWFTAAQLARLRLTLKKSMRWEGRSDSWFRRRMAEWRFAV